MISSIERIDNSSVFKLLKAARVGSFILIIAINYLAATEDAFIYKRLLPEQDTIPCTDWPVELKLGCSKLRKEGTSNLVLNSMILGLDALQLGYQEIAARCFDNAIEGIETVYADSQSAKKSRSLWVEEGYKDFKGEPYERAMAYYYRGLIDFMNGDYDNARASFRGGALQDAFAEEEQNRCDFALLVFLQGWCSQLMGETDPAHAAYEEVGLLRKGFCPPNREDNVLFLIELGNSPRKRTDGIGHANLKFFRGKNFLEDRVEVAIHDRTMGAYPLESIYWQASTRGGRPVDYILQGKAKFKETLNEIGAVGNNATVDTYANLYSGSSTGTALNVLGAAGGAIGLIAGGVKPKADARYWDNLPDSVHYLSAGLPAGHYTFVIRFYDGSGVAISELDRTIDFDVQEQGNNLVWVRSRRQISIK